MKKADAIKLIEEVLKNSYDYPAITILQKLEDAGMLPPFVGEKYEKPCKIFVSVLTDKAIYSGTSAWEDEKPA